MCTWIAAGAAVLVSLWLVCAFASYLQADWLEALFHPVRIPLLDVVGFAVMLCVALPGVLLSAVLPERFFRGVLAVPGLLASAWRFLRRLPRLLRPSPGGRLEPPLS